jgi:glycosyltransferase involved in cell wall biosynthesis
MTMSANQNQPVRKLLFITWDGPQTSYMEGLFMPIFEKVAALTNIEFHVLQFTWATSEKTEKVSALAAKMGINYNSYPIQRRPHPVIGSVLTVLKGKSVVEQYIERHQIDMVMPRSTFPALIVNLIRKKKFLLIFDADGLPLEERIDFGSLTTASRQYKFLKKQETIMLKAADAVITRSGKAIDIHIEKIGEQYRPKFSVVYNGRDESIFKPDEPSRAKKRQELGILPNEKVFLYCGSLGNQYGWDEMVAIFSKFVSTQPAHWLILTGDVGYAAERTPLSLKDNVTIMTSAFPDVPGYLNIADVAFAIRQPSYSMQGVAPIKLGEYLLMGIPTITSEGIGDTDEILKYMPHCLMYKHQPQATSIEEIDVWLSSIELVDKIAIREIALTFFSLSAAAESYMKALKN